MKKKWNLNIHVLNAGIDGKKNARYIKYNKSNNSQQINMVGKKPQKCSVKQVLAAIKDSGGIKTSIARKLKISRFTVDNYEKKYPTIAKAIEEERDQIRDKAESNIFEEIQDGDLKTSQWYLRYKGGYVEKSELDAKVDVNAKVKTVSKIKVNPKIARLVGDALAEEKAENEK